MPTHFTMNMNRNRSVATTTQSRPRAVVQTRASPGFSMFSRVRRPCAQLEFGRGGGCSACGSK